MFQFVVTCIGRSIECEKTAPTNGAHTRNNEIYADVTGDIEQRAWGEDGLGSLGSRAEDFKKIFMEAFDAHCDSGPYTLQCLLFDHMVEAIRRYGTLSILDCNLYEHFIVRFNQAYK